MDSDSDSSSSGSDPKNSPAPETENKRLSEDEEEIDRDEIRKNISEMSFEDLMKMKEKLGSKLYNATVYGTQETSKTTKKSYKRLNKNRPRETSSKRPVRIQNNAISVQKQHFRDPRFDPLCGSFNEKAFNNSYKFLTDVKLKERDALKKQLQNTEDPKEKKKIKFVLQRLENQMREKDRQEKKTAAVSKERQEIKEKIKKGEKVEFKSKSDRQVEDLVNKYEDLKKSNKLQKYMEKKSKKNVKKGAMNYLA